MGLAARITLRTGFWFIWESAGGEISSVDEVRERLAAGEVLPGVRLVLGRVTYDPTLLGLPSDPGDQRRVRLVDREIPWDLKPWSPLDICDPHCRIARIDTSQV